MQTHRSFPLFHVLLAISGLLGLSVAKAQHTAYVFNTDGAPVPAELIAAINDHGGPGTQIVEFGPGSAGSLNGVPVRDMGAVTLPRYDLGLGTGNPPNPEARHFIVAGDLTLTFGQSVWGWGSRLLKLEVFNDASLLPGSLITVAAQGRLGGAGGGDGGLAANHPANITRLGDVANYVGAAGGTATQGNGAGATGQLGQPVISASPPGAAVYPRPPIDYVSAISGAAGLAGQGDSYFYEVSIPGGIPQTEVRLSNGSGGLGSIYGGGYPAGGEGGLGGQAGFNFPAVSNGFNGGRGSDGGNGAQGLDGGNAAAPRTLAGTAIHLRGGTGGGAGATGGYGVGGRTGGGGGGGGISGSDLNFPIPRAGGTGGTGGRGGYPGGAGKGGNGGGGGGGLLLVVRGTLINSGTIQASGGNGQPGLVGGSGADGLGGTAGAAGASDLLKGGKGGDGGTGGRGGDGGHGGSGASGSGGNIQIAAGNYQQVAGVNFIVAGGTGAPAGLVQIHTFTGIAQNAPFGSGTSGANRYRSYYVPENIGFPLPLPSAVFTPYLPVMGGAATAGLTFQNTVSDAMITALQPQTAAAAAVVRVPANAFFSEMPDYDLIVFTSLKPGVDVLGPRLSLVSNLDFPNGGLFHVGAWKPDGPQWLLYNTGDINNPAFVPGAPGPGSGPIPWGRGFVTMVEKGKPFEVTAEYGPYDFLRTFKGTPALASLSPSNYTGAAVFLYDTGRLRATVTGQNTTNGGVVISQTESEVGTTVTGESFYRVGIPPSVNYSATNIGNAWSRATADYSIRYTPLGGSETTVNYSVGNAAPGSFAISRSITAASTSVPNTQALIAEFTLTPNYSFSSPQPIVQTVYANVLGPQSTLSGLTNTALGQGLHFSASSLTPATQSFQLTNTAPVRAEWQSFANANPLFTRLGVVSASFIGANAAAFSVSAPSTLDRSAAGNVAITFTPPGAGSFSAVLRLITDEGVASTAAGRIIDIPVTAFVGIMETYDIWALPLAAGKRGRNDDANSNGIPNFLEYGLRGSTLPAVTAIRLPGAQTNAMMNFTIPIADRPDVRWSILGSTDLQNWQPLARRSTTGAWSLTNPADALSEVINGGARQMSYTRTGSGPHYFMRLAASDPDIASSYTNDFSVAPRAILRGDAIWDAGSLRLTDSVNGAEGSAVLDGLEVWPGQTGFSATFNLTTGPGSIPNPADGASFSVGTLPNDYSWGEDGPYPDDSPRNLTIVFDTYGFNTGFETSRGIKIRVNGGLVLYSAVNPYSNGAARAVEITYTPTEGLTVKYNGSNVFTNVALSGFALQPSDRFGFGGRTGGLNQVNRIDDVNIQPR